MTEIGALREPAFFCARPEVDIGLAAWLQSKAN